MNTPTLHPRTQILFAALSAADFALTWWLLSRAGGQAYEANPIARWWLTQFGWLGLACFKLTIVTVVLGLATVIARSNSRVAGHVLRAGSACVALVVAYSVALGCTTPAAEQVDELGFLKPSAEMQALNRHAASFQRERESLRTLLRQLSEDVSAGRRPLREAAGRMQEVAERDPAIMRMLTQAYPDVPPGQRFACWLVNYALAPIRHNPALLRPLVRKFTEEFQACYEAQLPRRLVEASKSAENQPEQTRRSGFGANRRFGKRHGPRFQDSH